MATFSLCALSIDRFHAATGPGPLQTPKVEPCQSILSKLSVIWVGSMVLAAPELLLWQLLQETVSLPTLPTDLQQGQLGGSLMAAFRARTDKFKVDICVREPSAELPDSILSLVLTYDEARMWWFFGCYICLPLLFTLACDLVTRQVLVQRLPQKPGGDKLTSRCSSSSSSSSSTKKKPHAREQRLRSTVMALTILYITCNLPESVCNIILAYVSTHVTAALPALALPALGLIGQFLLFLRCSATPVLLLVLCRSLGQAFMDCCCCCCEECLPDGNSSSSSSASTTATSNLSSPTSLSPPSLSASSKEETKSTSVTEPAVCYDRVKDSSPCIGTPC